MTDLDQLRGFYAVVNLPDGVVDVQAAGTLTEQLLLGGASALQVRLKQATDAQVLAVSREVAKRVRAHDAMLVINDRLDLALLVGADAVHLGQDDLSLALAKKAIADSGRQLLIGVSTHNLAQVDAAVRGGADYLGFGPVFATASKENPDPVRGLDGLLEAVRRAGPVPVVAIGGITPARAALVAKTGAAFACAIAAVNGADDIVSAGRQLAAAFVA